MSDKQTKKLRKFYRQDIQAQFSLIDSALRPKPWYVPMWVWKRILSIVFLKIGKYL